MSPWALLAITAGVIAGLWLLWPRAALLEHMQINPAGDALTADYMEAMLREEPANMELRLQLAGKRLALGQIARAREVLEPVRLSAQVAMRRRQDLLELEILEAEAARVPTPQEQAAALDGLRRHLTQMAAADDWPPAQLLQIARRARNLGMTQLSAELDRRLARAGAPLEWITEAADRALGSGDYRGAARLYFAAREQTADLETERRLFLKAVATLRSGNLLQEALTEADAHIGRLQGDDETLAYLARLALAAGDAARAQAYVKRMLRLSGPAPTSPAAPAQALLGWLLDRLVAPARAAEAASPPGAAGASPIGRPYDEEIYKLAFDVFLANANVGDARRVAEAAVRQRPDDIAWRRRLAQTSEWTGHPREALGHWSIIAHRTQSGEAWEALLRLAPGLQEYDLLIEAWLREAGSRRLTIAEAKHVAEIHEIVGRAAGAIAFLKRQYDRHGEIAYLDLAAAAEERAGRIDEAINTIQRAYSLGPDDVDRSLRFAMLLVLRSRFSEAYEVLLRLVDSVVASDTVYWKTLADLAWQLQEDEMAKKAYGQLQTSGVAQADDVERLIGLLRPTRPEEARRLAFFAWQQWRSVSGLITALELANEARDYPGMRTLLDQAGGDAGQALQDNAYYFTLRAAYFQATGERAAAAAEMRRAMAVDAGNAELQLSYLWLLIDAREAHELRQRLQEWSGRNEPSWWDAYAAAWQVLGEPRRALPWLMRQAAGKAGDYLWLTNYAGTLEDAGQPAMAERVRRHAWLQARAHLRERPDLAREREPMLTYARLALRLAPGDTSLHAIRRLLREDRMVQPAPASPAGNAEAAGEAGREAQQRQDRAVDELVLSWALGGEHVDAARHWMWTRFAQRVDAPAWADLALALAEQDKPRLAAILAAPAEEPQGPSVARIDAARELGRTGQAIAMARTALARRPDDDEVHLRLATDLLATASSVIARDVLFTRGAVQGHEQSVGARHWITPQLRLAAELTVLRQHSADGTQLAPIPGSDRTLGLAALLRHETGESELLLTSRSGLASFHGLRLAHTRPLDERLNLQAALGWHERAPESVLLGIGAHKDEASMGLGYRPGGREFINARLWSARFHTQQDQGLGNGRGVSAEAGYRLSSSWPDANVRLSRVVSHFAAAGTVTDATAGLLPGAPASAGADLLMPRSFRLWGINAGFGTDVREQRSRALRPFADFGRNVSSAAGSGYNWLLGAGGSVLGPDHLAIYWLRSRGGGIGAAVRELGLRYQVFMQ